MSGIWEQVVQEVARLRDESSMLKLFTEHVKGEEMYGLTIHAVMRITESVRKEKCISVFQIVLNLCFTLIEVFYEPAFSRIRSC